MRIVLIGVGHWHTRLYLEPALALAGVAVVGVSDPDAAALARVAARARAPAFADYREMCQRVRPDFAFVLGRHDEMAAAARFLIEARIPFAIEKPAGVDAAEVEDLARRARDAQAFATPCFVMRLSPLVQAVREIAGDAPPSLMAFKFVAGTVERYRKAKVPWMLERASAGGGCLLNLGVHFLDLCRVLAGAEPVVVGAAMSNALARLDIEDHALVLLRAGAAQCCVETGYAYPAPTAVFDLHFSIRTARHYFAARDAKSFEIVDESERVERRALDTTNMPCYPLFVADVLRRVERGEPPLADLDDMAAAMRLVDAAYRMAPLG
jgi:predicted dehydrogenase